MSNARSMHWYFNYLILSLRLIGLQLNVRQTTTTTTTALGMTSTKRSKAKCLDFCCIFLATVIFLFSLTLTTLTQLYLMRIGSSSDALYNIFSLLKLIFSLVIVASFYRRRVAASQLLKQIDDSFHLFMIDTKVVLIMTKLRHKSIVLCLLSWTAIIYFSMANVYFNLIDIDLDQYLRSYWLGLQLSDIGRIGALFLGSLETIIYYLSTFSPTLFCSMYYTFLCSLITTLFREFNTWLASHRHLTWRQALHVRRLHHQLCSLANHFDDVLSIVAFFVYLIIVTDLSKYVYYLITKYLLISKEQNITQPLFVLTRVVHLLWLFFWISINASKIAGVSDRSLSIVHHMTTEAVDEPSHSCHTLKLYSSHAFDHHLSYQTMLLVMKLNEKSVVFTVWKIFPITKGFILTILGAVLTYTIILLQLTPWVQPI